jgi:hypothetical protein
MATASRLCARCACADTGVASRPKTIKAIASGPHRADGAANEACIFVS